MIIDVEVDRLLVVSDLHLGSPASSATWRVVDFLAYAGEEGWNVCINGDGFDLLQSRLTRFLRSAGPVARALRGLREKGLQTFYTIGNHDLALEHVLEDLPIDLVPFLNVTSGDVRIRVEHGHLYEPFFAKHPNLYELGGRMSRSLLFMRADFYKIWSRMQLRTDRRRRKATNYPPYEAADMMFGRGFDAVVLGHTHLPELRHLDRGLFVNCGTWMKGGDFVRIDNGAISLESWTARAPIPTR